VGKGAEGVGRQKVKRGVAKSSTTRKRKGKLDQSWRWKYQQARRLKGKKCLRICSWGGRDGTRGANRAPRVREAAQEHVRRPRYLKRGVGLGCHNERA